MESNEGNEMRIIDKEFIKSFNILKDVDIESIVSRVTSDGHLKNDVQRLHNLV